MSANTLSSDAHLANALEFTKIEDPGSGNTIQTGNKGLAYCPLITAGAEARALADPTAPNDRLLIYMLTDGGDATVTATSALDEAGNVALVFSEVGEYVDLISVHDAAGTLAWRINGSDGVSGASVSMGGLIVSGTTYLSGGERTPQVSVPDGTTYTVLASNSGKIHIIPDLTGSCTLSLPAAAGGLLYEFWTGGVAADAQNWVFDTGSDTNFFLGGLVELDTTAATVVLEAPDGDSNSIMTVVTPAGGTLIKMYCDGTNWFLNGTVHSETADAVTWADQ